jgi:Glycosyltransferase sugar-binding region containing DXD motif
MAEAQGMHLFQYWDSGEPDASLTALLASYQAQNPHMQYRCFSRAQAAAFIGERYGSRLLTAFNSCAVPAMRADYFRYCAVHAMGGFYADADTLCTGTVDSMLPRDADAVLFRREPRLPVVNCIFGFRHPEHALLATVLEIATANVENRIANNVWVATGPGIFTALHELLRMRPDERARVPEGVVWGTNSSTPGAGGVSEQDVATLISVCYKTLVRRGEDIDALFRRVSVLRFPQDAFSCKDDIELPYKATARHWTNWPGSIFLDA